MATLKTDSELVPAARTEGDAVLVSLRGEIDLHNSPTIRNTLLGFLDAQKPRKLILNLGQVPYMDSSAIAVLVEALQKLRRADAKNKLFLTNLQPRVKGLLEIARLDSIFVLSASEAEALQK